MNPIQITSPLDPRIADYSLLKKKETILDRFIADHEKTVIRLLESELETLSLFLTEKYYIKHEEFIWKHLPLDRPVYVANQEVFEQTIGYSVHRGFMGVGRIPMDWGFPAFSKIIVATNEIADSENMGSIIRTSTAFGVEQIITDSQSCSPWLRRSIRVSMGNIFYSKIRRTIDMCSDLKRLKSEGYRIIGMSLPIFGREDLTRRLDEFVFPERIVVVLGNEANGLQDGIRNECDLFLTIPMNPRVDSLNVSHSLAVALGQIWVQKNQQFISPKSV